MKRKARKNQAHSRLQSRSGPTKPRKKTPHRRSASRRKPTDTNKVAHVVTTMRRERVSLARAARQEGISGNRVLELARSALRKLPSGRYAARSTDRVHRDMRILTPEGVRDVTVPTSKDATLIGEHWNAVHRHLAKGDGRALDRFRETHITDVNGDRFLLLTDRAAIDRFGHAGVLSFESTYSKVV